MTIRTVRDYDELRRCYSVMKQLRQHLGEEEFVERAWRQMERYGYAVAYVEENGEVRAVAGYRISECLCDRKFLYVDDLVSDEPYRSKGYGGVLFDWLVETARENGCAELSLESGVQRHGAHRFYLAKRMRISSYHFSLRLDAPAAGDAEVGCRRQS